jgi:molybdopterin synthase catalytic subunit
MFRLAREPIDVAGIRRDLAREEDGAVVVFEGIVRNHSRGRRVRALEYSAYEAMALRELEQVGTSTRQRFDIRDISIVHRIGRLLPGDCSVAIVVASAHRAAAFDACRFAIDAIKQKVPIWKKESYEDGEAWVEGSD